MESALSLADFARCASVAISYRRDAFARCQGDNRRRIEEAIQSGRVRALMPSTISVIEPTRVLLKGADDAVEALQDDAVIAQIGGTAPADLLKTFGINLVTKYGER